MEFMEIIHKTTLVPWAITLYNTCELAQATPEDILANKLTEDKDSTQILQWEN